MKRGCSSNPLLEVTQIGAGDVLSEIICCAADAALLRCTLSGTIRYSSLNPAVFCPKMMPFFCYIFNVVSPYMLQILIIYYL